MVGVPFFVSRCDGGPSSPDRLALALLDAQRGDDARAEKEDENSAVAVAPPVRKVM